MIKRFFNRLACVLMMFACVLGISVTPAYAAEPSSVATEQTTDVVDENGESFSGKSTKTLDSTPQSFMNSGSIKITYQVNEPPVVETTPTHVDLQTGVNSCVRLASLFLITAVFALCTVIYGMRHEKGGKHHA